MMLVLKISLIIADLRRKNTVSNMFPATSIMLVHKISLIIADSRRKISVSKMFPPTSIMLALKISLIIEDLRRSNSVSKMIIFLATSMMLALKIGTSRPSNSNSMVSPGTWNTSSAMVFVKDSNGTVILGYTPAAEVKLNCGHTKNVDGTSRPSKLDSNADINDSDLNARNKIVVKIKHDTERKSVTFSDDS